MDLDDLKTRLRYATDDVRAAIKADPQRFRLIVGASLAAILVLVLVGVWLPRLFRDRPSRDQTLEVDTMIAAAPPEVQTLSTQLAADPRFENIELVPDINEQRPTESSVLFRGSVPTDAALDDLKTLADEVVPDLGKLFVVSVVSD